jgi:GAF domain-containing protein
MENVLALARIGLADRAFDEVLQEITEVADKALQGAESTSITLIRGARPFTAAHVGSLALDADELQYEQGHGPCMDAGRSGAVLVIEDIATIGALNVYATAPGAFNCDDVAVAEEVASYIAAATASCATSPGRWSTGRLTPDQRRAGSGDVPAWSSRHYA